MRSKLLENEIKRLKTLEQRPALKSPKAKIAHKTSDDGQVDEQVDKQVDKQLDKWVEKSANRGEPAEGEELPRLKAKHAKLAFLYQT